MVHLYIGIHPVHAICYGRIMHTLSLSLGTLKVTLPHSPFLLFTPSSLQNSVAKDLRNKYLTEKGNMASVCPVLFLILAVGWAAMPVMSEIDVQLNESRYQKFLRQHFDPNMAVKKCDSTIKSRKIFGNEDTHSCKQVNTFIAAGNKNDIKNVCDKAGSPYRGNLRISNKPFHVITCDLKGGSGRPPCEYRGHSSTRKIVIGCENKLPVHYEEGIIIPSANESV
uniref:Angiogenin-like n=1 Tax=Paramormyrops kingsleyae TaxID=1676925 RepID=A0A3B3R351_9TELE